MREISELILLRMASDGSLYARYEAPTIAKTATLTIVPASLMWSMTTWTGDLNTLNRAPPFFGIAES